MGRVPKKVFSFNFLKPRTQMGITGNCAKFLFYAKKDGASFEKTLTLGRQQLYAERELITYYFKKYLSVDKPLPGGSYAEDLFFGLGATAVDSIDISDYEGATIIHDLNKSVPQHLHDRFSTIVDGGTLEHIFDFPTAIMNIMSMLKTGGRFISVSPANNQLGHGFYQFSPELFFAVFAPANGFKVRTLFLAVDDNEDRAWFEVQNPAQVGSRVTLNNVNQTFNLLIAEKLKPATGQLKVFQNDYMVAWSEKSRQTVQKENVARKLYRAIVPEGVRGWIYDKLKGQARAKNISNLGMGNPEHFTKIEF